MTESDELRRSDARRNREAILAAALEALTESPDASLNAFARRAGVANATLYRHFPTREELVLAAYEQEVRKVRTGDEQDPPDAHRPPRGDRRRLSGRRAQFGFRVPRHAASKSD